MDYNVLIEKSRETGKKTGIQRDNSTIITTNAVNTEK